MTAISHGNSRQGPWRLLLSPGRSMGLDVALLTNLGFSSLLKAWKEFAPKRRNDPALLYV
ncbi:MAG: hypothetical protein MUC43_17745 [Pirellula sp.]|nr:hypothetical protein [Pirellula sp.]